MPPKHALFETGPGSTNGNRHLVEMKAGKMYQKGTMVYPDKRKGKIYIYQSDDHLMHFCWQDRINGIIDDDLIIFPDDCEYFKITKCTSGRVYLLKFKKSSRRFFYWLQEPKLDKDEEHCIRINEILNNRPKTNSQRIHPLRPESELQFLLNNPQFLQMLGSRSGQIGTLANILGTIRAPSNNPPTSTASTTNPTDVSSNNSTTSLSTTSSNKEITQKDSKNNNDNDDDDKNKKE